MNDNINNLPNPENLEPCVIVEFIDRDFDDSAYRHPERLGGEMQQLRGVQSPEDLQPVPIKGQPARDRFSPDKPQTWRLTSTTPDRYFNGLRSCLADDDPRAFPEVQIRSATLQLPSGRALPAKISGTLPKLPQKSGGIADLAFAAAEIAGIAAKDITVKIADRTHHAAEKHKAGAKQHEKQLPAKKDSENTAAVSSTVATADMAATIHPAGAELLKTVLGFRSDFSPTPEQQFYRVFPAGFNCCSCQQPLTEMGETCIKCAKPSGLAFDTVKQVTIGNQPAPWLDAALAYTRLKFSFLWVLLIALPSYLVYQNLVSPANLVIPVLAGAVTLFFWRLIAIFLRRRSAIKSRRTEYLQQHPETLKEIRDCIMQGKYDARMAPVELELVAGMNIFSDIKNRTLIFFIGDLRRQQKK